MSKTSYFLVAIMAAALIYMGAVRGYQAYERKAAERAAEQEAQSGVFTFQNVPVSLSAPMPEPVSAPVRFDDTQTAIFLETPPLSEPLQQQQAQDTIDSILQDYQEDPLIQQFNADLAAATDGNVDGLGALSGAELVKLLQANPEISEVVEKNMKNPAFAQTIEQIFSNPQYIESIKKLQGNAATLGAPKAKKAE